MNSRCSNNFRTYSGCTMSENFKNFQFFADWCNRQKGFGQADRGGKFPIDKDILFKGNKVYSEDTCVFVPRDVNVLLVRCNVFRGDLPVGVSLHKNKVMYRANCSDPFTEKKVWLGSFSSPLSAFEAYKEYKELMLRKMAYKYVGVVDDRVVAALLSYNVEVTD